MQWQICIINDFYFYRPAVKHPGLIDSAQHLFKRMPLNLHGEKTIYNIRIFQLLSIASWAERPLMINGFTEISDNVYSLRHVVYISLFLSRSLFKQPSFHKQRDHCLTTRLHDRIINNFMFLLLQTLTHTHTHTTGRCKSGLYACLFQTEHIHILYISFKRWRVKVRIHIFN